MSQNCSHQKAYCSSPRLYASMESNGDDDACWEELLTRPPELCGSPISRVIWEQIGGMDKGVRILPTSI
jgi:hypothetical protein